MLRTNEVWLVRENNEDYSKTKAAQAKQDNQLNSEYQYYIRSSRSNLQREYNFKKKENEQNTFLNRKVKLIFLIIKHYNYDNEKEIVYQRQSRVHHFKSHKYKNSSNDDKRNTYEDKKSYSRSRDKNDKLNKEKKIKNLKLDSMDNKVDKKYLNENKSYNLYTLRSSIESYTSKHKHKKEKNYKNKDSRSQNERDSINEMSLNSRTSSSKSRSRSYKTKNDKSRQNAKKKRKHTNSGYSSYSASASHFSRKNKKYYNKYSGKRDYDSQDNKLRNHRNNYNLEKKAREEGSSASLENKKNYKNKKNYNDKEKYSSRDDKSFDSHIYKYRREKISNKRAKREYKRKYSSSVSSSYRSRGSKRHINYRKKSSKNKNRNNRKTSYKKFDPAIVLSVNKKSLSKSSYSSRKVSSRKYSESYVHNKYKNKGRFINKTKDQFSHKSSGSYSKNKNSKYSSYSSQKHDNKNSYSKKYSTSSNDSRRSKDAGHYEYKIGTVLNNKYKVR